MFFARRVPGGNALATASGAFRQATTSTTAAWTTTATTAPTDVPEKPTIDFASALEPPAQSIIPKPTPRQMTIHGFNSAIPFVGFGLMDNTIMIHAGDFIDQTIGVSLGLPTLMAAASGQILSDFCGVCFGGCIESLAVKLGLPSSGMTLEQLQLSQCGFIRTACSALGVLIGCSLAMVQMFFMDLNKAERLKAKKEVAPLFKAIAQEAKELLDCNRVTFYVLTQSHKPVTMSLGDTVSDEQPVPEKSKDVLYSLGFRSEVPTKDDLRRAFTSIDANQDEVITFKELEVVLGRLGYRQPVRSTRNLVAAVEDALRKSNFKSSDNEDALDFEAFSNLVPVLLQHLGTEIAILVEDSHFLKRAILNGAGGQVTNITDHEEWHKQHSGDVPLRWRCLTGVKTRSVLICPAIDRESGRVVGLMEAVNKKTGVFDATDERVVQALASHASSVLQQRGMIDMIAKDFER